MASGDLIGACESHRRKGFYETLTVLQSNLSRSSAKFVVLARQNSVSPSRTYGYHRGVAVTATLINRLVLRAAEWFLIEIGSRNRHQLFVTATTQRTTSGTQLLQLIFHCTARLVVTTRRTAVAFSL